MQSLGQWSEQGGRQDGRRPRGETTCALVAVAVLSVLLAACAPESPSLGGANAAQAPRAAGGIASPLSDGEFAALPLDDRYRVVNKLLGTLYDGMPVSEFYAIGPGSAMSAALDPTLAPSTLRAKLATPMDPVERARIDLEIVGDEEARDDDGTLAPIEAAYRFDDNRPAQMPLARMREYPISKDRYSQWMAWQLANTILFSPAEEIDSADMTDVQNLFRRLDLGILQGKSIRDMVAVHQRSVENWRRFRSPEDNTREMMEIYLGLFDRDDEVPLASQACQDLYLTDENDGYKLARTDFPNVEPVLVLDQYVTTCADFYDAVAGHALLIPRVTAVIVDRLFAGTAPERRVAITEAVAATNPRTFEDIFTTVLFSSAYLLDAERPKAFEENYLALAARLEWDTHPEILQGMISGRGRYARAEMREMGWPAMSLKLGRTPDVPLDSLSFGNQHKALRETLLMDVGRWQETLDLKRPDAPRPRAPEAPDDPADAKAAAAYRTALERHAEELDALSPEERQAWNEAQGEYLAAQGGFARIDDMNVAQLVDYLFLTVAQRRATQEERSSLHAIFYAEGLLDEDLANSFAESGRQPQIARIAFDYLSRLPETYYLPRLR